MFRFHVVALLFCAALLSAESGSVWIDVPFVKQERNGCGAASIAMLMRYWARENADPQRIQQAVYSEDLHGIRGASVEGYLRDNGFRTFVFKGEWSDLEQHVAKGRPLMVSLHQSRGGPFHYVVGSGSCAKHCSGQ
jgi:predicted double-glycine peptidase